MAPALDNDPRPIGADPWIDDSHMDRSEREVDGSCHQGKGPCFDILGGDIVGDVHDRRLRDAGKDCSLHLSGVERPEVG